ncbi:glycoside hydrolase family protein [Paenibacillus alba]|uniref:Glycoside hydrolase family protein n=1 Tax=Paenibacillus alba TaxID=1197127 RepID=A0ABU6GB33_9BACL|nr:glycoside hydrolase family protein [Paenibacillus alba]MEC0231408.1 glycoside hydrolase family protein [Paenibacillus alba]
MFQTLLPAPLQGGFRMEGYWVWCGSCVKGEDGRFHLFASRWPKALPMHPGWLVQSEIVRAVSDHPEGPYTFQEVVLPARGAEYWDGRSTHNPQIVKHGGKYLLFYMGSTHPLKEPVAGDGYGLDDPRCIVARANKRIGLAVSDSVTGPWERRDAPILATRPGKFDSFLTSNPAPCIREDGSVLLIYKARKYEGHVHGKMTFGAAHADHYEGPYRVLSENPLFPPDVHLEDPFVWQTPEGYELLAKDMEGNLCGEKYGGIHAYSADGLNWEIGKEPLAYSRSVLWDDGIVRQMGNLERPFLLFQEGKPTHLFAATSNGTNGFHDATETWNMVIPIAQGTSSKLGGLT